jgi:hypothetical protein
MKQALELPYLSSHQFNDILQAFLGGIHEVNILSWYNSSIAVLTSNWYFLSKKIDGSKLKPAFG